MKPDFERRGSKKSISPSSTIFGFFGLCASMGWMGSSADIAGGAAIIPTDSSDAINVRNIIVLSLKNAAVVAQPMTPTNYPLSVPLVPYRVSCRTSSGRMYSETSENICPGSPESGIRCIFRISFIRDEEWNLRDMALSGSQLERFQQDREGSNY